MSIEDKAFVDDGLMNNNGMGGKKGGWSMKKKVCLFTSLICGLACFAIVVVLAALALYYINPNQTKIFPNPNYSISNDTIHFLVIGDFGSGNEEQIKVAKGMNYFCQNVKKCDFIIGLGDNIYDDGVTSVNDIQFKEKFEDIYFFDNSSLKIDWYNTLGNHDYRGDIAAQVEYTSKSKYWKMPDYFYSIVKPSKLNTFNLTIILTDTNALISSCGSGCNRTAYNTQKQRKDEQINWMKNIIKKNFENYENSWTIVAGHHPLYSAGIHFNNGEIIDLFESTFKEYKIPLYLSAHDHVMNWLTNKSIKNETERTHYIVSGGGGGSIRFQLRNNNLMNYDNGHGFFSVEVQKEFIFVIALNGEGKELWRFRIDRW
ncbi:hypothetical protein ABK040_010907 [Willaertia magna]